MHGDQIAGSIYYVLLLVLVGSSLMLRRLPRGKMISLGLAWAAIIVLLALIVAAIQRSI